VGPADTAIRERIDRYLDLYDHALPEVYGYVRRRVDSTIVAEDVTAETFVSALDTLKRAAAVEPSIPWLIGVARHKLADHWRRQAGENRRVAAVGRASGQEARVQLSSDGWDAVLDATLAHETLARLSTNHRAALSFRYLDGLPVGDVAHLLGRSVGATEALLTRAKAAFRAAYPGDRPPGSSTGSDQEPGAHHA
jgi:RNA polymerase sigma-70 factor (ECF subfamily)